MVPNHLFQLISLTAMEPPSSFDANAVRDEQTKVLRAIEPCTPEEVLRRTVRGQYGAGVVNGEARKAYRSEDNVPPDSHTETFVALKLYVDNWRWADVPFYLRTGKALPKRETTITIQFKRPPFLLFRDTPVEQLDPNRLVLHIQPDEGISLSFGAKLPGPQLRLGNVDMSFDYADYFGTAPSTGYERLLYDCMTGDATLFQRSDMVEAGWTIVEPILDVWKALPARDFPNYAAGSWGPREATELMVAQRTPVVRRRGRRRHAAAPQDPRLMGRTPSIDVPGLELDEAIRAGCYERNEADFIRRSVAPGRHRHRPRRARWRAHDAARRARRARWIGDRDRAERGPCRAPRRSRSGRRRGGPSHDRDSGGRRRRRRAVAARLGAGAGVTARLAHAARARHRPAGSRRARARGQGRRRAAARAGVVHED